jgi:hypothetical protein
LGSLFIKRSKESKNNSTSSDDFSLSLAGSFLEHIVDPETARIEKIEEHLQHEDCIDQYACWESMPADELRGFSIRASEVHDALVNAVSNLVSAGMCSEAVY